MPVNSALAEKMTTSLTTSDKIEILMHDYDNMRAEIRMYIEQYSPKFSIFGIFVLSAFVFAFQNPKYQLVYIIIPFFIFVIGFFTIAQAYIITLIGSRIRIIENDINKLNNGKNILNFETEIAYTMVYPPLIKLLLKNSKKKRILNPIFISVVSLIIAVFPLILFCLYKAYYFINNPFNYIYIIFIFILSLLLIMQCFSFFKLGSLTETIDYSKTKNS